MRFTKEEEKFLDEPIINMICPGTISRRNYLHYLTEIKIESKGKKETEYVCLIKECSQFGGEDGRKRSKEKSW